MSVVVVVLGCTVHPDGTPSNWLTDRLLLAKQLLRFLCLHSDTLGYANPSQPFCVDVVLSGAAVSSPISEAHCMREWLRKELLSQSKEPLRFAVSEESDTATALRATQDASNTHVVHVTLLEETRAVDTLDNIMLSLDLLSAMRNLFTIVSPVNPAASCRVGGGSLGESVVGATIPRESPPSLGFPDLMFVVTSDFHLERSSVLLENELRHRRFSATVMRVYEDEATPPNSTDDASDVHATANCSASARIGDLEKGAALWTDEWITLCQQSAAKNLSRSATGGDEFVVVGLGARTPSLVGEALHRRIEREIFLTKENTAAQELRWRDQPQ